MKMKPFFNISVGLIAFALFFSGALMGGALVDPAIDNSNNNNLFALLSGILLIAYFIFTHIHKDTEKNLIKIYEDEK